MEFASCLNKQKRIKELFLSLKTPEERYEQIITMGRELPLLPKKEQVAENLVAGCQSILYCKLTLHEGKVHIHAFSDALISSGLAALLYAIYQDEPPQAILQCPPLFLKEVGILESLSTNRSNGLSNLYQKMSRDAIKLISYQQDL